MGPRGLEDFAGRWTISRRIDDMRAGAEALFEGLAVFRAAASGLRCEEKGRLRYAGQAPLPGTRSYLWRAEAPGRIAVDYADGRPFHAFALGPVAEARHRCDPDLYLVTYDFTDWPRWRATWRVSGPRKDYVSVSDYAREPGEA